MKYLMAWWSLNKEAYLILKRDKIFLAAIVAGLFIALFANSASAWTIEEFEKILFDIGTAGFRLTGGALALLWGIRSITDPLSDRSIELRIASPMARFVWILSRFTGLSICLLVIGVIFAGLWQIIMYLNQFGTMDNLQSWSLAMLVVEWLVLGSIGILLGTLSSFSIAVFAGVGLWVVGLISPLVAATLSAEMEPSQRKTIEWLATTWNFQRFNLMEQIEAGSHTVSTVDILTRLGWAGSVLIGTMVLACWVFQEKDLT
jgi:ABC-type transport system involved in multi-copper enzyme maturation permease subunit